MICQHKTELAKWRLLFYLGALRGQGRDSGALKEDSSEALGRKLLQGVGLGGGRSRGPVSVAARGQDHGRGRCSRITLESDRPVFEFQPRHLGAVISPL